jgi:hypothetical protein
VYRAPSLDRNLTGFEPDKLKDGTVTFIAATQNDSPTISMNFTGASKLETGTSADVGYRNGDLCIRRLPGWTQHILPVWIYSVDR